VLQTCFFAISGVLEREAAIEAIKASIQKTYGKRRRDREAQHRGGRPLARGPSPG
jgi:pyruvate-ferredoxin/flavodoxin oxidoreductase